MKKLSKPGEFLKVEKLLNNESLNRSRIDVTKLNITPDKSMNIHDSSVQMLSSFHEGEFSTSKITEKDI